MPHALHLLKRRSILAVLLLCGVYVPAAQAGGGWQQPTPEELKMTADPAAPDAAAIYLFREEITDDKLHMHSLYVRIKVLNERGKEYGDVQIPAYEGRTFDITDVAGRTVQPDGTVVPFTGKPIEKMLMRSGGTKVMTKVFSLPDVQVGSILEYRYKLRYDNNVLLSPKWYIQQPIFVRRAHYHFVPSDSRYITDGEHGDAADRLVYAWVLDPGQTVKFDTTGYDLVVNSVAPLPDEAYMPPLRGTSKRLLFYYTGAAKPEDYWKIQGKYWSRRVEHFSTPSNDLRATANQIVALGKTQEERLRLLYAAVMKLENTDFTREHSAAENKAEGLKIKTADDIWKAKRGSGDELARLFLALARASGYKAYAMIVTDRDQNILMPSYLEWSQLDDEIAIVNLDGKEMFFDPGQRYCEFGKLHWKHTMSQGVRETEHGTEIAATPSMSYKDTQVGRFADLTLSPEGELSGTVRITYTGAEALHWRQRALEVDAAELNREYDHSVEREFPQGVTVSIDHFIGLEDSDHALMAQMKPSGHLGAATGKRLLLPSAFFTSAQSDLFAHARRDNPVDLHYPVLERDSVVIALPPGLKAENVPKDAEIPLPQNADYAIQYKPKDGTYGYARRFILANTLYTAAEYPDLRGFYQKIKSKDEEQAVFSLAPATTASSIPPPAVKAQ